VTVSVFRCRGCGLVYADPQPRPIDLQQHYDTPPENYWSRAYFEATSEISPTLEDARKLIRSGARPRAIDVGAGVGKSMVALEKAGFEAHGLEPSMSFFERAHTTLTPDLRARLTCAPVETAVFDEGAFDLVLFSATLEHMVDPSVALGRALSWLRPGGLVIAEVPSSRWLMGRLINLYFRFIGTRFVTNLSPMHAPFHLFEFTERSFRAFAARSGARIEKVRFYPTLALVPTLAAGPMIWLMAVTRTGMQLEVFLRKEAESRG
jgi:SAM-dependent methyltransferase